MIKIDLEKPLTVDLVKGFRKLDLDKSEILASTLFLLDTSGSMDDNVKGKRKIDSLREVMAKIPSANILAFSSDVHTITNGKIPIPSGSTHLAGAFNYINNIPNTTKPKKVVLVSDGEPDSKSDALKLARVLGFPIDVIYIGNEKDGEEFMKELAEQTNGKQITV